MAHRQHSTVFKKWDLQLTFPAIYKVHTYVTACIYVTGFAKTRHNHAITEIQFIA